MKTNTFVGIMAATCLTCLLLDFCAAAETQNSGAPSVMVIGDWAAHSTNGARKLMSISAEGTNEIATLQYGVLFGTDDKVAAFLQTPANGPHSGSRLLVVDRNTLAVIADKIIQGLQPNVMKIPDANCLAVKSSQSLVYLAQFGTNGFSVAEANWATGKTRTLDIHFDPGSLRHEITSLYPTPSGIGVGRDAFLLIFDPATETTMLSLTGTYGRDLRATSGYYAVPDYGLVKSSSSGMFSRATGPDFSKLLENSAEFPNLEQNRQRHSWRVGLNIKGRPCLAWGENEYGVTPRDWTISRIAIFDLDSKKIMLRKSLGGDFSSGFLANPPGTRLYFTDVHNSEIVCLDMGSQTLSTFLKFPAYGFETCVAAN